MTDLAPELYKRSRKTKLNVQTISNSTKDQEKLTDCDKILSITSSAVAFDAYVNGTVARDKFSAFLLAPWVSGGGKGGGGGGTFIFTPRETGPLPPLL